eukprot:INCI9358.2.p1 GENE.INCI9358.2~~INCI9358.2.p1  ORF type:complete len:900 (-),score=119.73 INCI9358.2:1898-4597(-)
MELPTLLRTLRTCLDPLKSWPSAQHDDIAALLLSRKMAKAMRRWKLRDQFLVALSVLNPTSLELQERKDDFVRRQFARIRGHEQRIIVLNNIFGRGAVPLSGKVSVAPLPTGSNLKQTDASDYVETLFSSFETILTVADSFSDAEMDRLLLCVLEEPSKTLQLLLQTAFTNSAHINKISGFVSHSFHNFCRLKAGRGASFVDGNPVSNLLRQLTAALKAVGKKSLDHSQRSGDVGAIIDCFTVVSGSRLARQCLQNLCRLVSRLLTTEICEELVESVTMFSNDVVDTGRQDKRKSPGNNDAQSKEMHVFDIDEFIHSEALPTFVAFSESVFSSQDISGVPDVFSVVGAAVLLEYAYADEHILHCRRSKLCTFQRTKFVDALVSSCRTLAVVLQATTAYWALWLHSRKKGHSKMTRCNRLIELFTLDGYYRRFHRLASVIVDDIVWHCEQYSGAAFSVEGNGTGALFARCHPILDVAVQDSVQNLRRSLQVSALDGHAAASLSGWLKSDVSLWIFPVVCVLVDHCGAVVGGVNVARSGPGGGICVPPGMWRALAGTNATLQGPGSSVSACGKAFKLMQMLTDAGQFSSSCSHGATYLRLASATPTHAKLCVSSFPQLGDATFLHECWTRIQMGGANRGGSDPQLTSAQRLVAACAEATLKGSQWELECLYEKVLPALLLSIDCHKGAQRWENVCFPRFCDGGRNGELSVEPMCYDAHETTATAEAELATTAAQFELLAVVHVIFRVAGSMICMRSLAGGIGRRIRIQLRILHRTYFCRPTATLLSHGFGLSLQLMMCTLKRLVVGSKLLDESGILEQTALFAVSILQKLDTNEAWCALAQCAPNEQHPLCPRCLAGLLHQTFNVLQSFGPGAEPGTARAVTLQVRQCMSAMHRVLTRLTA